MLGSVNVLFKGPKTVVFPKQEIINLKKKEIIVSGADKKYAKKLSTHCKIDYSL